MLGLLNRILIASVLGLAASATAGAAEPSTPSASAGGAATATAACTLIRTPADLNRVRYNLTGNFCLANDLDFALAEFVPIGSARYPFLGTFDGQGHTIRNYNMNSAFPNVGLFGVVGAADVTPGVRGVIRNVTVEAAELDAIGTDVNAGVLVGTLARSGVIANSRTWSLYFNAHGPAGGLAGLNEGEITGSQSFVPVIGSYRHDAGGLVGLNRGRVSHSNARGTVGEGNNNGGLVGLNQGHIWRSYATGAVGITPWGRIGRRTAGGLVGENAAGGRIVQSFAVGEVAALSGASGGLVGYNFDGAFVSQSYATGPLDSYGSWDSENSVACGGLVGWNEAASIAQSYAAGAIYRYDCDSSGGLVASDDSASRTGRSYWDRDTTKISASAAGVPLTTVELQKQLPPGFSPEAWAVTPNVTYPFLKAVGFKSTLATTVFGNRVLSFVPISQLDKWHYGEPVANGQHASKAAVFTMVARAIGVAYTGWDTLDQVKIDTYFWEDTVRRNYWQGPVTGFAHLGRFTSLGPAESLATSALIEALRNDRVVAVQGAYDGQARPVIHWMLVTSFTVDLSGEIDRFFANDPWTGRQVQIDPSTRMVVSPAAFPLPNWRINGFQVIGFRAPPDPE